MLHVRRDIEYLESDGLPITDQDLNRYLMEDTEFALREHFRQQRDKVYVSANLFIYYISSIPPESG